MTVVEKVKKLFGMNKKSNPKKREIRKEKREISLEEEEWLSYYIS